MVLIYVSGYFHPDPEIFYFSILIQIIMNIYFILSDYLIFLEERLPDA